MRFSALAVIAALPLTVAAAAEKPQPPVAQARPQQLEAHGQVRVDPYYWLKDRENPEVIAYLEAENAYLDQTLKHTEALQENLLKEITGRVKEDDSSVPFLSTYDYDMATREQTPSGSPSCAPRRPTTTGSFSRPTWRRDTADRPAASNSTGRPRSPTRSCWTSSESRTGPSLPRAERPPEGPLADG